MERAFVDTGAWIAFFNRADPDREAVRSAIHSWRGRLVTSNLVFVETVTLSLYRFGHPVALKVGDALQDGKTVDLVRVEPDDEQEAWSLLRQRPDKTYSMTDGTSFVMMRRIGITQALALDADFSREGFTVTPG